MKQVLTGIAVLLALIPIGTAGFMTWEKLGILDALYLTVMTITTVGYGDIVPVSTTGRFFALFLVLSGLGFLLYVLGKITEIMVEGSLRTTFERRSMEKQIARLKDHYIVCGHGRIGKVICQLLHENRRPFVVIENNPDEVTNLTAEGFYVVAGNASDEEILRKASVDKAKGLIAVVSSDAENVYTILSAKELNPGLFVLARSSGEKNAETKMLRAGADKVISPYYIGACRMAQLVMRPTVIDFIDLTVRSGELGLRLEELSISGKAAFVGKTLSESGIRKEFDLIVVAIKRQGGEMQFNPNFDTRILEGDILVVLGEHSNIQKFEKQL